MQQDHVIKLPRPLNQSQVQSFVDDGFLIVPEVISQPELDELKQDTVDLARGKYPCPSLESLSPDTPDEQVLKNILCIHMPHYISPVMRKYVSHPSICSILSQITAAHLPHWDGSVKCMQSMLFIKPPGFQGQPGTSTRVATRLETNRWSAPGSRSVHFISRGKSLTGPRVKCHPALHLDIPRYY